MGKGRRRIDPEAEVKKLLRKQRKAFIKKFGREPGPHDPVFFDPKADAPEKIDQATFDAQLYDAMQKAGTPAHLVYAYRKTGLMLLEELRDTYPPDKVAEYDAAIAEYFALEKQSGGGGHPQ